MNGLLLHISLDHSYLTVFSLGMILGLIESYSTADYDCKFKKLQTLPALSYFAFCKILVVCLGMHASDIVTLL